jgi:hypothetical protein
MAGDMTTISSDNDEPLLDNRDYTGTDAASTVATMEPEGAEERDISGPRCEKCKAPLKSDIVNICPSCGWYASLGICVEVDPNWETATETATSPDATTQPSHLRVWLNLVPRWGWIMFACVLAVLIESVAVRLTTPDGGALRTVWSVSQLMVGFLAVAGCHIFNFLVLAARDTDFGIIDIVLKPLKLWIRAVHELPTRLWVATGAASGLSAVLASILIIGGLPYERLWDWGFEQPVKQNLMGAVMDRVKELESRNGSDNLEDAVNDFAGENGEGNETTKPTPEKPREKADCVILGYQVDRDGRLNSLILGTANRAKLIYAGRVTPEMSNDELSALLQDLMSIRVHQPFVAIEADAIWVKPKYTCRITYGERLKNGKLRETKWHGMLGQVRLAQ